MKKYFRIATMAYLMLLAATLGAGIYAGAVVAPVIFHSANWLGAKVLSHYQEGQIMSQNFLRLSYLVDLTVIVIFIYEGFKYKMSERDGITILASIIAIASGLFFAHYYLPNIITMQYAGSQMTQSAQFVSMHHTSEIDFEIFALSLFVIIIQNMRKACR